MTTSYSDLGTSTTGSLFQSLSRRLYPKTMKDMLDYAADLWLHEGLYTQTIRKSVRYFMTELEVQAEDSKTERAYLDFFSDNYDILDEGAMCGDEYMGFGNSFTSAYVPLIRKLTCPRCSTDFPYENATNLIKLEIPALQFKGTCPFCKSAATFKHTDLRKSQTDIAPSIIRWDPDIIDISYNEITRGKIISMNPSKGDCPFVQGIMKGDPTYIKDTPWEVIRAVVNKQSMKFHPENIHHMYHEPPAFISKYLKGWGMPPFMSDFGTVILILMLDKYNEAILSDYLVPMRVISPSRQSGAGGSMHMAPDLMSQVDFGEIKTKIDAMIREHRKNPTNIFSSPMALQYQIMGGEAKQLVPIEMMDHYETRLLHNMGYPLEFIQKTMTNSAAPIIGFKMFEKTWQHFSNALNHWFTWFGGVAGKVRKWDDVFIRTVPVSIYEDPEIKRIKMDLAGAGKLSMTTFFKTINLDYARELKRKVQEQELENDYLEQMQGLMEKKQINMEALQSIPAGAQLLMQEQQAQAGGGPPSADGGAMPPPMSGSGGGDAGNASLQELEAQAEQMAQQLFGMEATMRRSELINLSKNNEALHALVTKKLDQLEQTAETQGLAMARQQGAPPA